MSNEQRHTGKMADYPEDDTVAWTLAQWITSSTTASLPSIVTQAARDSMTDTLGVALAGAAHPASAKILNVVQSLGGKAQADVFGTNIRTSSTHAALANAYLAHVLDFDDTHTQAIAHVSSPVFAAALAASQAGDSTGEDLVTAHAMGLEVSSRIAVAMNGRDDHGWHLTGIAGTLGAAAAASRALRLTPYEAATALGISSTMASGMRVHRGTGAKSMSPAHAASSGVLAAVLSAAGMSSNTAFFEHPQHSFLTTFGFDTAPSSVVESLGSKFAMLQIAPKPYPSGITSHPAIDSALDILAREATLLTNPAIETVTVRVHPLALELTGNPKPQSGLEAKFSIVHAVATALLDHRISLDSFTDETVIRSDVRELQRRIIVMPDKGLTRQQASITIDLSSGDALTGTSTARGTAARPLSSVDIRQKFLELNQGTIGLDRCERIFDHIETLHTAVSLDAFGFAVSGRPYDSGRGTQRTT